MNRTRTTAFACSFFLLSFLGFCATHASARGTSAQLLRSTDDRLWYINRATLVRLPEQIVSFWSRIIPRKGSAYFRQEQSVLARAGKNAHRLAFFQRLDEVDCRDNRIRTLSVLYYDENDRILLSRSMLPAGWTAISPAGDDAVVREAVCDTEGTAADRISALHLSAAGEERAAVQDRPCVSTGGGNGRLSPTTHVRRREEARECRRHDGAHLPGMPPSEPRKESFAQVLCRRNTTYAPLPPLSRGPA